MKPLALLALLAPAVFVASSAHAEPAAEAIDYTVKKGDNCTSIAGAFYGDVHRVDLVHQLNPTLGPPPHYLRVGQVLHLPPKPTPEAEGPDATLTRVRNNVEVLAPEARRGKPNDPLFQGNRVGTKEASAADVTFRDETQVRLGENTLVVILGDNRSRTLATPRPTAALFVETGLRAMAIAREHTPSVSATHMQLSLGYRFGL
jgi:Tfp pilus assembly protein FimV